GHGREPGDLPSSWCPFSPRGWREGRTGRLRTYARTLARFALNALEALELSPLPARSPLSDKPAHPAQTRRGRARLHGLTTLVLWACWASQVAAQDGDFGATAVVQRKFTSSHHEDASAAGTSLELEQRSDVPRSLGDVVREAPGARI